MTAVNIGPASSSSTNPVAATYDPLTTQLSAAGLTFGKLAACAIPFIIAPTGTMGNNGAITLGTALPVTYANAYIFLPSGAIQAGSSAGWYFCQMSSTTVGTVYSNTYNAPGLPTIPVNPTTFVSTGPGAYTGVTSATNGPQIAILANSVGLNGVVRMTSLWSVLNNVNAKTIAYSLGGNNILSTSIPSVGAAQVQNLTYNRGVPGSNISLPGGGTTGLGTASANANQTGINFGSNQTAALNATMATATDFMVMEAFLIEIFPG